MAVWIWINCLANLLLKKCSLMLFRSYCIKTTKPISKILGVILTWETSLPIYFNVFAYKMSWIHRGTAKRLFHNKLYCFEDLKITTESRWWLLLREQIINLEPSKSKNGSKDRLTSTSEFAAELVVLWSELLCWSFTKLCKSFVSSLEMCVALLSGAFGSLSYSGEGAILKEEQSDDTKS